VRQLRLAVTPPEARNPEPDLIHLSVNVNKIATLRNSRGGQIPSVIAAVDACLAAGAPGITVHPRADARHITARDVVEVAERLAPVRGRVEYNIEGDPRADLIAMVREVRPDQCTLVPVMPGEVTSQAGWRIDRPTSGLREAIDALKTDGIRVSLFVDPEPSAIDWAGGLDSDRIELYTEPYARAFERGGLERRRSYERYRAAAQHAHDRGLGVNAGHDLDLDNLPLFASIPHVAEVSIGHALVSLAVFVGLQQSVIEYLDAIRRGQQIEPERFFAETSGPQE
jgi:pyridoxine 5-phosphate synthase